MLPGAILLILCAQIKESNSLHSTCQELGDIGTCGSITLRNAKESCLWLTRVTECDWVSNKYSFNFQESNFMFIHFSGCQGRTGNSGSAPGDCLQKSPYSILRKQDGLPRRSFCCKDCNRWVTSGTFIVIEISWQTCTICSSWTRASWSAMAHKLNKCTHRRR